MHAGRVAPHDGEPGRLDSPSRAFEPFHVLVDGTRVRLDPLGRADRDDLLTGFADLSRRSRYLRFFSAMPRLNDRLLEQLLDTDPVRHVAIGARLVDADGHVEGRIVGVARYFVSEESNDTVEPAVAVIDELHGRGLGILLLKTLTKWARSRGFATMRTHTLADNARIRRIVDASRGVLVERDGPVLIYDVDIRPKRRSADRTSGSGLNPPATSAKALEPGLEREIYDGRQIQRQQLRDE
jgi:GNAT superfamily N-acetyltransferase